MLARGLAQSAIVCFVLLVSISCDQAGPQNQPTQTPANTNQSTTKMAHRYSLEQIENGVFKGTALLDHHTGQVWALGTDSSKSGQITSLSFSEVPVIPRPAISLDDEARYELHGIRNGNFAGTALVDRKTGAVWTLASDTAKGHVSGLILTQAEVYPEPK